jgi:DNA-binding response OmpR family regulator
MSSTPNDIAHPAAPVIAPNAQPRRRAVLLVEDDRSIRRYLEVILQRAGFDVTTAADGLEGMKAALSNSFDAVVTDAIMPHLNGYELCRFIRRHPKLSATPVVLLSGTDHDAHTSATDAQADVYLSKPVRPEELTGCIARLLPQD